jgi:hypothetical protein
MCVVAMCVVAMCVDPAAQAVVTGRAADPRLLQNACRLSIHKGKSTARPAMSTIASMPPIAVHAALAPRPVAMDAERDANADHPAPNDNPDDRAKSAANAEPALLPPPPRPTATLGNLLDAMA